MAEVQDIFQQHGQAFRQNHKLPKNVRKAMFAIENCRTSALGGHMDTCDECGYSRISYNSCRNRHCPKCQTLTRERWFGILQLPANHRGSGFVQCLLYATP